MSAEPEAPRRTSLGRRLFLSLLTMLVPLVLVAGVALYAHYGSTVEQARIESETVEEFAAISTARDAAERLRTEAKEVRSAPRAHTIGRAAEAHTALLRAVE